MPSFNYKEGKVPICGYSNKIIGKEKFSMEVHKLQ